MSANILLKKDNVKIDIIQICYYFNFSPQRRKIMERDNFYFHVCEKIKKMLGKYEMVTETVAYWPNIPVIKELCLKCLDPNFKINQKFVEVLCKEGLCDLSGVVPPKIKEIVLSLVKVDEFKNEIWIILPASRPKSIADPAGYELKVWLGKLK
jgi:hypothetical protein